MYRNASLVVVIKEGEVYFWRTDCDYMAQRLISGDKDVPPRSQSVGLPLIANPFIMTILINEYSHTTPEGEIVADHRIATRNLKSEVQLSFCSKGVSPTL